MPPPRARLAATSTSSSVAIRLDVERDQPVADEEGAKTGCSNDRQVPAERERQGHPADADPKSEDADVADHPGEHPDAKPSDVRRRISEQAVRVRAVGHIGSISQTTERHRLDFRRRASRNDSRQAVAGFGARNRQRPERWSNR